MQAISFIFQTMKRFVDFLDTPIFTYNNADISLLDINLVFLIIGLVAAVFWRGSRAQEVFMVILPAIPIFWTNTYLGFVFLLTLAFAAILRLMRL